VTSFPLPGANWSYLHVPTLKATTGAAGFALANATPTIFQWTAPNDGNVHRIMLIAQLNVTSAETGGVVNLQFTDLQGNFQSRQTFAGALGTGFTQGSSPMSFLVQAGQTVFLAQSSALTLGLATVFAELWAL
jgi:hypothetical protein